MAQLYVAKAVALSGNSVISAFLRQFFIKLDTALFLMFVCSIASISPFNRPTSTAVMQSPLLNWFAMLWHQIRQS